MKLIKNFILIFFVLSASTFAEINSEFENWKKQFKNLALENQISEKTFDTAMSHVIFLPKVIEYDRFQPEFYEDTKTYITKRSSRIKVKKGVDFYRKKIGRASCRERV